MAIAVKPGYHNPLRMMGQNENRLTSGPSPAEPEKKADSVRNLQQQRQTLQNQILLLKSSSDSAGMSQESQEVLEQQLEKVSHQLKTAEADQASVTDAKAARPSAMKARFDSYEPDNSESPGLYQLQPDQETGYGIKFAPFSG